MEKYRGIIVEEALDNKLLLNQFEICKSVVTNQINPADRWHMYEVVASKEQIEMMKNHIVGNWYIHFWKNNEVIALFKDKSFIFNYSDKSTWDEVVQYGKSIGIPDEELDFPINGL